MRKAFLDPVPRVCAPVEQDRRRRHRLALSLLAGLLLLVLTTAISLLVDRSAGPVDPWTWLLPHCLAVLAAGLGGWLLRPVPGQQPNVARPDPRPDDPPAITTDLLVNLARRNQSALYRQLEVIDRLQRADRAPDARAELGTLARMAIRVRRNADRLLVLAGEPTARTGSPPAPLGELVDAAVADIEDADRIVFEADQMYAITAHAVPDLVLLVAELAENAVRSSPPDRAVAVRARCDQPNGGELLLTVEDWGVGMSPAELAAANASLTTPTTIDRSGSPRLGFPVVARLAARHGIAVSLGATPTSGVTATIVLPPALLAAAAPDAVSAAEAEPRTEAVPVVAGAAVPEMAGTGSPLITGSGVAVMAGPGMPVVAEAGMPVVAEAASPVVAEAEMPVVAEAGMPVVAEAASPVANEVAGSPVANEVAGSVGRPVADAVPVTLSLPAARPAENTPWPGWWAADADAETAEAGRGGPDDPPLVPSPRPRSAPIDLPVDPVSGLRKRVPQAHLAPELLRQPTTPNGRRIPGPGLSAEAALALSRYQTSRSAARTLTGNEHGWLS